AGDLAEGTVAVSPFDPEKPEFQAFQDKYMARYTEFTSPDEVHWGVSATAYDALFVMWKAIEAAQFDRTAVKAVLEQIQNMPSASGGVGSTISFSADRRDGYGPEGIVMFQVKGGGLEKLMVGSQ